MENKIIRAGISVRHIHVSKEHRDTLFGREHELTFFKDLSQKGQFASKETVTLIGEKGCIENVRILGPERKDTQIEISKTDAYKLGINVPVRDSGDIDGTPGVVIIGPKGTIKVYRGLICTKRHIHMTPADASFFNVKDGQMICVKTNGERSVVFENTLVRVNDSYTLEFHIDTDEANAAGLNNNDVVDIR